MSYRVVIAEDYKMIRDVFESAVEESDEFLLGGSFSTAEQAVEYCRTHPTELVILDILFPGSMNGLDAAELLKMQQPDIKLLLVTSMPEASYLSRAKRIGVDSFWYKEIQEQSILEIMRRTVAGESVYPLQTPQVKLGNILSDKLTERELSVLRELVGGASNREIGETLGIAEKTVKMHITNMLQKTGYRSRLELALQARHIGIAIKD